MTFNKATALAAAFCVLSSSVAFAGDSSVPVSASAQTQQGALAPGHAAGIKPAQGFAESTTFFVIVGAAVVIGGIALIASGGNGHGTSTTSSTTP